MSDAIGLIILVLFLGILCSKNGLTISINDKSYTIKFEDKAKE